MAGIRTCDGKSQVQRPNHYTTEPPDFVKLFTCLWCASLSQNGAVWYQPGQWWHVSDTLAVSLGLHWSCVVDTLNVHMLHRTVWILCTCSDTESAKAKCRAEPVVLTDDNVWEFRVTDLVLPLPGYDIKYPDNETASWYRELLAADGFEDFSFRSRVK